jgi:hypothetical protein
MTEFAIKVENNEVEFIYDGEWSLETTKIPKPFKHFDYIMTQLSITEPRTMYGMNGAELSLPSEIHRVSGICFDKPEAQFTIKRVDIDFLNPNIEVLEEYLFEVKQWPEGFVKITKIK